MLTHHDVGVIPRCSRNVVAPRQEGVTLMIALILLVVMTLGGIAMVRTVDTGLLIAGNMAFQQSATRSGEAATEDAVRFLESSTQQSLWSDILSSGYTASTPASGNPAHWETYWNNTLNPNPASLPVTVKTCVDRVCTLPTDGARNTVSYVIQRLCLNSGDPLLTATACSNAPEKTVTKGASKGSGAIPLPEPVKYYYRITARVVGPRNSISYVQTIVAK